MPLSNNSILPEFLYNLFNGITKEVKAVNNISLKECVDIINTKSSMLFSRNINQDDFITQLQNNISKVILESDITSYEGIESRLEELQQELLNKINTRENYDDIADEILKLRELQQKSTLDSATRNELLNRISELQEFIKNQSTTITEFDEKLIRRLINKIWVFDDRLVFEFKTGLTIDIHN